MSLLVFGVLLLVGLDKGVTACAVSINKTKPVLSMFPYVYKYTYEMQSS